MQKVSKQSLAMLALSILLAISIALTFTFAALGVQQKDVSGTITFTGGLSIAVTDITATDGVSLTGGNTLAFTAEAFEYNVDKFVLTDAAKAALATSDITVTSTAGAGVDFYYSIAVSATSDAKAKIVNGSGVVGSTQVTGATEKVVGLEEVISDIQLTDSVDGVTFTITIKADYAAIA